MNDKEDLIKLSKKRKVSEKLHDWNQDDMAIGYYFSQYDLEGLRIDLSYLCNCIIGTTVDSIKMQSANINSYLIGEGTGLNDVKPYQIAAVEMYSKLSKSELLTKVKDIINLREADEKLIEKNQHDVGVRIKKIITQRKEKQRKEDLNEIFRKMGKDPSKMKKVQK